MHANRTDARVDSPPRVGFVVSRSVGNAVVRNRTKRRLRGIMTTQLSGIPLGWDVVVRANPAAAAATYDELSQAVQRQLGRVAEVPA